MSCPTVQAAYHSPDHDSFTAKKELSTSSTSAAATPAKIKYLASLREAVTAVQAEVNRELTSRMAADAGPAKEEENYGEEMVEE